MAAARWTPARLAAVAAGGALGAGTRWLVLHAVESPAFPWPVLALNVVGSFVLGILLAEEARVRDGRTLLHDVGGIGFCGGLTTFSTFAVETVQLVGDGDGELAAAYVAASLVGALGALVLGAAVLHRVRSVAEPLEELP